MSLNSRGPGPPLVLRPTLLIILIFFIGAVLSETNKKYHMQNLCKTNFLQRLYRKIDGAELNSQNERNLNCVITFQTHSILQRFMLRFDMMNLDCNDHLFIYDGAHAVGNHKADLSCRNTKQTVGAIFTRTNFVTLKYVTDGWGTESNGFSMVITAVKDPTHTCKDFTCSSQKFCIATDLVCDGINHCADGSDEAISTKCSHTERTLILGMSMTLFVVLVVSGILVVCACVGGVSVCVCRKQAATPPHHPPPSYNTNLPMQQMQGNGTGAGTTIVSKLSGNWHHPAGQMLGYSAARVRLYCQAK